MTAMAELELKQRLARLSARERRGMSAYLLRLKHESAGGRRALSQAMRSMDQGEKMSLKELSK